MTSSLIFRSSRATRAVQPLMRSRRECVGSARYPRCSCGARMIRCSQIAISPTSWIASLMPTCTAMSDLRTWSSRMRRTSYPISCHGLPTEPGQIHRRLPSRQASVPTVRARLMCARRPSFIPSWPHGSPGQMPLPLLRCRLEVRARASRGRHSATAWTNSRRGFVPWVSNEATECRSSSPRGPISSPSCTHAGPSGRASSSPIPAWALRASVGPSEGRAPATSSVFPPALSSHGPSPSPGSESAVDPWPVSPSRVHLEAP
ncbi:unannotated protein [freshwater metagenome]|uniref:Unannotated protein n=1 Tax=freshwater metagenome TaxID=449393 RepID=A0A6J7HL13_9ZZZZ